MFSSTPYNIRNVWIKTTITVFVTIGIFCAIYASRSCRWFVFTHDKLLAESWDFLPQDNTTVSIGLFRYQRSFNDNNDHDRTAQTEPFVNSGDVQCHQYNPLFLGRGYSWMFTAQICVVIGPVLAFVAWLMSMIGVNKNPTAFFMLMGTGVQSAGVVASMSWCDEFWNCPWLLGSLANVVATCLFFLSWMLAMCGLVKEQPKKQSSDDDHPSNVVTTTNGEASQLEGSFISYEISVPEGEREEVHEHKQSAEDLLGTNDPIVLRAVAQSARVVRDLTSTLRKRRELVNENDEEREASDLETGVERETDP